MAGSYYKFVSAFTASGFVTEGFLAPRCPRVLAHTVPTTITATMRVVSGVHYDTADGWPSAHVTAASRLAKLNILV